jgi:TolA-binding protein
MNESQLKELLAGADQAFGTQSAMDSAVLVQNAQRRAAIRQRRRAEWLAGGTLAILLAVCLLGYVPFRRYQEKKQIARQIEIQKELDDLRTQAQQTLALIQSVNERTRTRKQLTSLQQRLASIAAQSAETENTDDQLASQLYQKAQMLAAQADSCSAVKALYQQIIRTFPNSSYTHEAKTKVTQLDCPNGVHL